MLDLPNFGNRNPMEMNIYTTNIKTAVTWHHDYGYRGLKK